VLVPCSGLGAKATTLVAATPVLKGDSDTARLILRDLDIATIFQAVREIAGAFSSRLILLVVCRPQMPKTLASKNLEF
jgi:hypothetical protein